MASRKGPINKCILNRGKGVVLCFCQIFQIPNGQRSGTEALLQYKQYMTSSSLNPKIWVELCSQHWEHFFSPPVHQNLPPWGTPPSQFPLFWYVQSKPFNTCQSVRARCVKLTPTSCAHDISWFQLVPQLPWWSSMSPLISLCPQLKSLNIPQRWWQWGVMEHKVTRWSSVCVQVCMCVYKVVASRAVCGAVAWAQQGAVLRVTRLLSFFHVQPSFTSGDSWEKDERNSLKKRQGRWGVGGGLW